MASAADGAKTEYYQGMPQLDPAFFGNQILWFTLAIIAIYFIMSRVALPRIGSIIEERNDAIADDLEQAAEFKRRAEEAEEAYETALKEARAEAQRIAAEAKAEIQAELDDAKAKADAEIAARASESEARIQDIRASALKSIEDVANETASEIVGALMPGASDAKAIAAAVTAKVKG
jgi:F-type H+-transporting ATPase subunit b